MSGDIGQWHRPTQYLPLSSEILPSASLSTTHQELQQQAPRLPWLLRKRTLLVLSVVRTQNCKRDPRVLHKHGNVIPQLSRRQSPRLPQLQLVLYSHSPLSSPSPSLLSSRSKILPAAPPPSPSNSTPLASSLLQSASFLIFCTYFLRTSPCTQQQQFAILKKTKMTLGFRNSYESMKRKILKP